MAYIPASNSVVAFQSQPSSLLVGASIIGLTPVTITSGNSSVTGTMSVLGTVPVTQATTPWIVNMPSSSVIAYQAAGSIMQVTGGGGGTQYLENAQAASVTGTAVMFKSNLTTSILSVVTPNTPLPIVGSISGVAGASIIGIGILNQAEGGSAQLSLATSSFNRVFNGVNWDRQAGNSSIGTLVSTGSSSVITQPASGTWITSVMNTNPSSLMVGASIFGTVPVTQTTSPWVVNVPTPSYIAYQLAGSILAVSATVNTGNSSVQLLQGVAAIGSVATLQGTNPWIVNVPTPSYLSIQPGGSVLNATISGSVAAAVTNFTASVAANINVISASIITNQGTNPWVIGSIVGTQTEDAASATADKGIFSLNVRNDTMSSVTNADGDYTAWTMGPVGEGIIANAPITKWVYGATSIMYGPSVQVLAAPGTSIFTYITGINVINESATLSRVTITQGLGRVPASMLTWAVAPANGGSNATYVNPIRVLDNNGISASISGVSSVYVTITGFTSKT